MNMNMNSIFMMNVVLIGVIIICLINMSSLVEGYESLTQCIEQGYPHNFCLHVPVQSVLSNHYKLWTKKFKTV